MDIVNAKWFCKRELIEGVQQFSFLLLVFYLFISCLFLLNKLSTLFELSIFYFISISFIFRHQDREPQYTACKKKVIISCVPMNKVSEKINPI